MDDTTHNLGLLECKVRLTTKLKYDSLEPSLGFVKTFNQGLVVVIVELFVIVNALSHGW